MSDISDDESIYSEDEIPNTKSIIKKKDPSVRIAQSDDEDDDDDDANSDDDVADKKIDETSSQSDNEEKYEDNDDDMDIADADILLNKSLGVTSKKTKLSEIPLDIEYDGSSDDNMSEDEDVDYLKKFDENIRQNIIADYHPEINQHNYEEIEALCIILRNEMGVIVDPFHKTLPFITKYEKTRILGERASQINSGGKPYVEIDSSVIDGYLIAVKELEEKKIPYIIRRPLPNGGCEYWKLKDLELLI